MSTNKNTHVTRFIAGVLITLFAVNFSFAAESEMGHEESIKRHGIGVFVGATHAEEEYLETVGIEYGYFLNKSVEVGLVVERAVREDNSTLAIAFVSWRPLPRIFFGAGIGRKDPGPDRKNTLRLSIGYDFELSHHWSLEPQIHVDFIEEEENEEVLGVAIIRRF